MSNQAPNAHGQSLSGNWRIRINTVVWFVLGLGFLLSIPVITDWAAWVYLVLLGFAMVLAAPTAWGVGLVLPGYRQQSFLARWFRFSAGWLFTLSILAVAPIYYLATITETRPVLAPQVALSNGHKTVIFQGMMHIGSENFYRAVMYDIEQAMADGYVLYYEGVQTSSPESEAFFQKLSRELTGNQDLAGVYKTLGQACGLKFQSDYFALLQADQREHPERHIIADVDAIELQQEYLRLMQADPDFAAAHADDFTTEPEAGVSGETMASAVEWLESGAEGQRKLAGIICRGVMTAGLSSAGQEVQASPFDPIILDYRNRSLVRQIQESPHEKIFITYGSNHLPGVMALLQEQDPSWEIGSVKWFRTIETPRTYERRLQGIPGE